MGDTLLDKWLEHYDPIHRGWTISGIANGVCATNGFSFPRVGGGYNLHRAVDGASFQDAMIVGAAGADARAISTFPWIDHAAGTSYVYRLTSIGGGGVGNFEDAVTTRVVFDETGCWTGRSPNAPIDLRVYAVSGGRFELRWRYVLCGEQVSPRHFRVCRDGGGFVADIDHVRGRCDYRYVSESFAHGTRVEWMVRAVSADGVDDGNVIGVCGEAADVTSSVRPSVQVERVAAGL